MAVFYADSSVLVKRHVNEIGSGWVQQLFNPAQQHTIITVRLSTVEVISALNRRVREGTLAQLVYRAVHDDFLALCRTQYRIVVLSSALFTRARALLERHPLRTYDALHLAAALVAHRRVVASGTAPLTFLAADQRLLAAAAAEGLATDNPLTHP